MQNNIEVKKVKLVNGSILIGGLIDDGIIGKNHISLGDPAEIKTKKKNMKKHMRMKRCIPVHDMNKIFNIPIEMVVSITSPNDATFQKYHDQIMKESVLNEPMIH